MTLGSYLSGFFGKKKKALVLGGGSARGLAHIGVLSVFQKEKIKFDFVVGTSMGAIIGAYYCMGKDITKTEEIADRFNVQENLDFILPPMMGLIKGKKIHAIIRELLDDKKFSDLKTPLAVVATDIEKGEEVVFTEGGLVDTVMASCCYPGIFMPQLINGRLLVDGGIINTVPVSVARKMGADIVVAVDVGFCVQVGKIRNIFGVILQAFQISGDALSRYQAMHADIVIRPDLDSINQLDFQNAKIAIQKGEIAAIEKIKKIKRKLRRR